MDLMDEDDNSLITELDSLSLKVHKVPYGINDVAARLPVLVYRRCIGSPPGDPEPIEKIFSRNGYDPEWRFSMYPFPHYHSNTHEVLGVYQGSAKLHFGDPTKPVIEVVSAGDVIIIPAGVLHWAICGDGFNMIGAYPRGVEKWDLCRGNENESEKERIRANVNRLPNEIPAKDPVYGDKGPLHNTWKGEQ